MLISSHYSTVEFPLNYCCTSPHGGFSSPSLEAPVKGLGFWSFRSQNRGMGWQLSPTSTNYFISGCCQMHWSFYVRSHIQRSRRLTLKAAQSESWIRLRMDDAWAAAACCSPTCLIRGSLGSKEKSKARERKIRCERRCSVCMGLVFSSQQQCKQLVSIDLGANVSH